jgi:hypothetical protein
MLFLPEEITAIFSKEEVLIGPNVAESYVSDRTLILQELIVGCCTRGHGLCV